MINAFKQFEFCKSYPQPRELFMPTKVPPHLDHQEIMESDEEVKSENLDGPQKLFSTKQIGQEAEQKPYTLTMSPRKPKLDQNTLKSL